VGDINNMARNIILLSVDKVGKLQTAKRYSIPFSVIDQYLLDIDQGTLTGREIIRVDMALRMGRKVTEKERYKGGR
jgi:hypothetical protein